jgi:hypothetical protein
LQVALFLELRQTALDFDLHLASPQYVLLGLPGGHVAADQVVALGLILSPGRAVQQNRQQEERQNGRETGSG